MISLLCLHHPCLVFSISPSISSSSYRYSSFTCKSVHRCPVLLTPRIHSLTRSQLRTYHVPDVGKTRVKRTSLLSSRKAIEELLKEAKRGKTRAETMGPMGWMKCPLAGTNKRFLINTIKNTLPSHKEQDPEQKEGSKEATKSQGQKEEKRKKHRGHPYKHSFQARAPEGHSPHRKPSSRDKSGKRSNRR
ncbi:protein POLR1D-like isoform X1 [Canis lupus baileyi]|uniref:protein POLR1D-like isoform X1 n=1 Tax=Canis lupus baileyi TaxID=143281 RepID=UPI003B96F1E4